MSSEGIASMKAGAAPSRLTAVKSSCMGIDAELNRIGRATVCADELSTPYVRRGNITVEEDMLFVEFG